MVRSVKIGISGFVFALIVCGIWFVVTNQAAKISQRAWHAQEEYVASQRAVTRGGSVEAMKRLAYGGCQFQSGSSDSAPAGDGLFLGSKDEQMAEAERESCINSYIYGDGLFEPMPYFFIWQWVAAVVVLCGYCAFVGLVLTAASEIVPLGFKTWWAWLIDK